MVQKKEDFKEIPLYRYSGTYAEQSGELDLYRASMRANIACKEAIENAINNGYHNNCLDDNVAEAVVAQFGISRVKYVLANTVQKEDWDARYSTANKEWANAISFVPDFYWGEDVHRRFIVGKCHPGLTNIFINQVRTLAAKK